MTTSPTGSTNRRRFIVWSPARCRRARYWNRARPLNVASWPSSRHVIAGWPASSHAFDEPPPRLCFLPLANACYGAVYIVDLFVQFSGLRESWAKGRVAVLAIGTAFAAVIAHFVCTNMLGAVWSSASSEVGRRRQLVTIPGLLPLVAVRLDSPTANE